MLLLKFTEHPRTQLQIFLTQFHFSPNPLIQIIRGHGIPGQNAPARYTLPAWKEKTQISQAQFRSKSGALCSREAEENEEENPRTGNSGKDQETTAGAISEGWF